MSWGVKNANCGISSGFLTSGVGVQARGVGTAPGRRFDVDTGHKRSGCQPRSRDRPRRRPAQPVPGRRGGSGHPGGLARPAPPQPLERRERGLVQRLERPRRLAAEQALWSGVRAGLDPHRWCWPWRRASPPTWACGSPSCSMIVPCLNRRSTLCSTDGYRTDVQPGQSRIHGGPGPEAVRKTETPTPDHSQGPSLAVSEILTWDTNHQLW